ncbi:hypothetical protein A3768_5500 (plasmid) [Ralstonia solanacearum]|nr:hypothetical protein A3768_5500 [Ralstonia solanacearum]
MHAVVARDRQAASPGRHRAHPSADLRWGSVGIVHASARLRRRLRMPTRPDGDVSMAQADWPARAPGTCLPGQREAPRGSAHGHAD